MARQTFFLAALLGLLFTISTASRTTITTIELDEYESNPGQRGSCREQVQQQQGLRQCQEYLQRSARRQGRYGVIALNSDVADSDNDSERRGSGEYEQLKRQCCNELRRVEGQCQCEAVKEIADRARQEVQRQGQQQQQQRELVQRMLQKARELPAECGVRSQPCDIRA